MIESFPAQYLPDTGLVSLLTRWRNPQNNLATAFVLWGTCKELKARIEKVSEIGLHCLSSFGLNLNLETFPKNQMWMDVGIQWLQTPVTVVLLDYSSSMDKLISDQVSHLETAAEMTSQLFEQQQQTLRPSMVVCPFGDSFFYVDINSPQEMVDFNNLYLGEQLDIERKSTQLTPVMRYLFSADSPLKNIPHVTKIAFKLISDHDIGGNTPTESAQILREAALSPESEIRDFTFESLPTTKADVTHDFRKQFTAELFKADPRRPKGRGKTRAPKRELLNLHFIRHDPPPKKIKIEVVEPTPAPAPLVNLLVDYPQTPPSPPATPPL